MIVVPRAGSVFRALRGDLWSNASLLYDPLTLTLLGANSVLSIYSAGRGRLVESSLQSGVFLAMPGAFISTLLSGNVLIGGAIGLSLDHRMAAAAGRAARWFRDMGSWRSFQGSGLSQQMLSSAWTMRQQMARDMASSVFNARQWLGREASFLHG